MSVVLATAGYDHKIRFWEAPSGICSRIIKFSDSQVNRLEITPDKQFIAAAGNPTIRLYEIAAATNATTTTTPSTNNKPPSSANANNNNYDTQQQQQQPNNSSTTGVVPPTQQPVLTLEGHTGNVTSLGFQKDGQYLYTGSEDGTVKIWDLRNPNYSRSFHSGSAVNSVTLRRDRDELISGDQNGYVKVWDLGGSGVVSNSSKTSSPSKSSSSSGCISSIQPAKVVSNVFHKKTNSYGGGSGGSTGSTGNPAVLNDRMNNNNNNNTNNNTMKQQQQQQYYYTEGITPIQSVDISEDSRTLVTITNHGTVFVWDPTSSSGSAVAVAAAAQQMEHLLGSTSTGEDNNNNNNNNTVPITNNMIVGNNSMRGMINPSYLRPVTKFRVANPGTYCLHGKIAPDCRHLVTTSSDGTAKLWDTITWEVTQTLVHRPIQHHGGNHHPHNNTTTAGGGGENSLSPPTAAVPVKRWVWDAAFCADSSYLVTACSDHVARLWNLRTGDVVRQYHGHQSAVTCVALNDRSI